MRMLQRERRRKRTHATLMCIGSSLSRPVSVSMYPDPRPLICTRVPVSFWMYLTNMPCVRVHFLCQHAEFLDGGGRCYEGKPERGRAKRGACSENLWSKGTEGASACRTEEEKRRTHARTDDLGADVKVAQRFQLDREFLLRPAALYIESN